MSTKDLPSAAEIRCAGSMSIPTRNDLLQVRLLQPNDLRQGETAEQMMERLERDKGTRLTAIVERGLRIESENQLSGLNASSTSLCPGRFTVTSASHFTGSESSISGVDYSHIFQCGVKDFMIEFCTGDGKLFHFPTKDKEYLHGPGELPPTKTLSVHIRNCFRYGCKIPSSVSKSKQGTKRVFPAFSGEFHDMVRAGSAATLATKRMKKSKKISVGMMTITSAGHWTTITGRVILEDPDYC